MQPYRLKRNQFYFLYHLKSIADIKTGRVEFDVESGIKFRVQYIGYNLQKNSRQIQYKFDIVNQTYESLFSIVLDASQIQRHLRHKWRIINMQKIVVHNIDDIYDT